MNSFTDPISETRQVLVQRKPRNWRSMTAEALNEKLIRESGWTSRKDYIMSRQDRHMPVTLFHWRGKIVDSINIIEVPYEPEKLIQHVANGEIEYTVCDENVALVNSTYYPDIDVSTPVSHISEYCMGSKEK